MSIFSLHGDRVITLSPCKENMHSITGQRKYACQKKNLNAKLIKLNYFSHGTVIHLTLVILLSSNLETIITQIEMKRQITKIKLSGLGYLILDMQEMK